MPTEKNAAPIQKEEPVLSLANGEEHGPNPKGVAGPKLMEMVVLVKDFDGGGNFGEGKGKVEALVEFWNLWWRRKKMKVKVWRSGGGCGGGDEESL